MLKSEASNQGDESLFDSQDSEGDSGVASTTDDDSEQGQEGEESKQPLKLDDSSAEVQKAKQIDVWAQKIERGEATIDDLPPKQAWLKPDLEKRLNAKKTDKKKESTQEMDIESVVERKLLEKEDKQYFLKQKAELSAKRLNVSEQKELEREFKEFRDMGILPGLALEKARKVAGISLNSSTARSDMEIPRPGAATRERKTDGDDGWKNQSESQRLDELMKDAGIKMG